MTKLELCLVLGILLVLVPQINAGTVGFGMTDMQSEVVMSPSQTEACVTYYIYNPSETPIEGYLDITREEGKGLNKLLGLDPLYNELTQLEGQMEELKTQYNSIIDQGQSTFEIETQMELITSKIQSVNSQISAKKPKSERINIPANTPAKDANGNFQKPVQICFKRPMIKYLFQNIGDTNFCGRYKGEVVGTYNPVDSGTGSTGSAIIGSRSTILKITIQCSGSEKRGALFKFIGGIALVFIVIGIAIWKLLKRKKPKRKITESHENPEDGEWKEA